MSCKGRGHNVITATMKAPPSKPAFLDSKRNVSNLRIALRTSCCYAEYGRTQNDGQMVARGARILRCQRLPNQVVGWTGLDSVDDLNELGYIWFGTSPLSSLSRLGSQA